jgi:alkanesulfonate monooxygenase SsuD/methylene tetrahydromethanopterin reductase-like flavin-dependent oxidoreductase (luciferase family)
MRFGLFGSAQARRNVPVAEARGGFDTYVEANIEAEALGYHSSFLVEHHFTGMGQVSSSLTVQSWVAAKTKTLRIGTAVIVLPWHNPVLLAEQAATVDLMSGGRLDFGAGRGYRHNEFEGFRIDVGEASARFEESLKLIVKSWVSETRFSHDGRFWQLDGILVEPPPAQRPHPPVWIAAGQPDSIRRVAALGGNLLLDQFAMPDAIAEKIALYKSEVEAHGRTFDPMQVAVARNVYVATSAADAEAALERQAQQHARMMALSQRPDGTNRSHITAYADQPGSTQASAIYGTPDRVAAELEALRKIGVRYVLLNSGVQARESMRRFAAQVMPDFAAD